MPAETILRGAQQSLQCLASLRVSVDLQTDLRIGRDLGVLADEAARACRSHVAEKRDDTALGWRGRRACDDIQIDNAAGAASSQSGAALQDYRQQT